jgi:Na+-driven multidrug efflux pump
MIPLMYILSYFLGLDGVWFSMPLGEILAGIWAGIWLYTRVRSL